MPQTGSRTAVERLLMAVRPVLRLRAARLPTAEGDCKGRKASLSLLGFSLPGENSSRKSQPLFSTGRCSLIASSPGKTGITHQLLTVRFSFLPSLDLHVHLIASVFQLHVQSAPLGFRFHEEIFVPAELLLRFLPFSPILLKVPR